jgi:integrase
LSGLKDKWTGANLSPLSRGNYARLVNVAFTYAVKRGFALSNPIKEIDKPVAVAGDIGILSVAQTTNLLVAASPELLPCVAIGAFAGLRRAEIERLDWSDVHFDSNLIEVTAEKAKTARRRLVTMQPNLREWLLPLRKHSGNVTPDDFRKQMAEARAAAGITEWPNNALRHSFASYHLAHFNDAAALALEMGHTNSAMIFNHYRELVKPQDAARYWNIKPEKASKKIVQIAAHA